MGSLKTTCMLFVGACLAVTQPAASDTHAYRDGKCPNDDKVLAAEMVEWILAGANVDGRTQCLDAKKERFIARWTSPIIESPTTIRVPDDAQFKILSVRSKSKTLQAVKFKIYFDGQVFQDSFIMRVVRVDDYVMEFGCAEIFDNPKAIFVYEQCD